MALTNIFANLFGEPLDITVKKDGVADDISWATGLTIVWRKPDGAESELTAAFKTDGTDGVLTYTLVSGDIAEGVTGDYQLRVVLTATDRRVPSSWVSFKVGA